MVRRSLAIGLPIGILLFAPTLLGPSNLPSTASCRPFDRLALAKLPVSWETAGGIKFQTAWNDWVARSDRSPLPETVDRRQIHIESTIGFTPGGPLHVDVRGQEYGSTWRLASRTAYLDRKLLTSRWSHWKVSDLSSDAAHKIDAMLRDGCLWNAPRFLESYAPLKAGDYGASYDGPVTFYDLKGHGRVWSGIQVSWRIGAPGRLASFLINKAFGYDAYIDAGFEGNRLSAEDVRLGLE